MIYLYMYYNYNCFYSFSSLQCQYKAKYMLKINKNVFLEALQISTSIINKKFQEDFIFLVHILNNECKIFTKNSNAKMIQSIFVESSLNTTFSVDPNILLDIIKKLDEDFITISILPSNQIKISNSKSEFKLFLLEASTEFEDFKNLNLNFITLPAQTLLYLLDNTAFGMSEDNYRVNIHGIFLTLHDSILSATSTDAHRMCYSKATLSTSQEFEFILQYRNVYDLIRILTFQTDIQLFVSDKTLIIKNDTLIFQCFLVMGDFPSQHSFLNTDKYKLKLALNTENIKHSIDRVTTIATEKSKLIKIDFQTAEISMYGQGKGFAKEHFELTDYMNIQIGFNSKYIQDALAKIKSKTFFLYLNSAESAVMITSENQNDKFIVMPIKLYNI